MNRKVTKGYCLLILMLLMFSSCIEEIDLETETSFESALVVEATITNELKQHKLLVSRTYRLEENGPSNESDAIVTLKGDGINYSFFESEPGVYLSNIAFAAEPNVNYQLEISTNDGRSYQSSITTLTAATAIDDLFFERGFNENEEEGVSVFVNAFDPSGNSRYYRYTYEETYKIIAPKYSPLDLIADPAPPAFILVTKPEPQQICYNTEQSNTIIITNTNQFLEDRLTKFRVLFLNRNNAIISHRYSILVNQYVQSREAHDFYNTLERLSSTESLLSQLQPGFLQGNIESLSSNAEKVLGFFEVSSVDSKRIYFNYEDVFPGELLPPYFISCSEFAPVEIKPGGTSPLLDALLQGNKYFKLNDDPHPILEEGAFDLVPPACGNCTVLGTLDPPDFWEE